MKNQTKILLTVVVVAVGGALSALGVYSAFSSTTSNPGNSFDAGSVTISDNDSGSALYNVTNQKPGVITEKCIKVTYGGSLDADVRLYASSVTAGGQYVDLLISSGTGTNANCSDFVIDGSGTPTVYSGTLKAFADARTNWATGLADYKLAQTKWSNTDAVTYRFRVNVQDVSAAQGASTGSHSFTWEAQNQ